MTIQRYLHQATRRLEKAGVGTARLDALVLLEDVTEHDRAWLLSHPDHKLSSEQIAILTKLLTRRTNHEPLAYLRKKTEFYGREFIITPAVLEPRPESETMLDLLKKLPSLPAEPRIADVGAGSGALGINAALELPKATVELLEVDTNALKVAKMNVDKYTMNIPVLKSDLLTNSAQANDVLLCNLPYVPDNHMINKAASQEPAIAIFGGTDGLKLYRELFNQVEQLTKRPLFILTEALPPQHATLADIAQQSGYKLTETDDFIQVFRYSSN